ncbi:cell division ATP-binding protein FtsE [Bifidobacterium dolichotidis]|uniref:Cell division ATP-binding protein FtsE n=1 Tax=Bifidobacterium dolichotidis TaxID=2306976 RepID=A0A430FPT8_9BIFI|nr:cell division ATP-binding protein FtsE [Bifidobacterium dolichotidis]RSX54850.1 cell division ATP-binding protein FtsE [Bifidobacterium dolichotidis]
MALISLEHVSKIYPRATRPALDDINLEIDRGDFVFLVGSSGSGKTSLLRLMLREEEATDGEIRIGGYDLRRLPDKQVPHFRRTVGTVFQDYKLLMNKTVWQNVAFTLEVIGTPRSTIRSLVPKVLQTVGLTGKEKNMPHELSGGEQQRVAIARAYVNHPQILLADEPTGNLDPTTSLGIMEVLDAINRTGTTIVMATHNEEIVNSMRKRVVELNKGKIVRDERNGLYDSQLYFPDAQVQAQSHDAIANTRAVIAELPHQQRLDSERDAAGLVQAVSASLNAEHADEGIARLARSVHAGNTGRYGDAFAPVEQTLTWGKGLNLQSMKDDESAAATSSDSASEVTSDSASDAASDSAFNSASESTSTVSSEAADSATATASADSAAVPAAPATSDSSAVLSETVAMAPIVDDSSDTALNSSDTALAASSETHVAAVPAPPAPPVPPAPRAVPVPPVPVTQDSTSIPVPAPQSLNSDEHAFAGQSQEPQAQEETR